MTVVSTFAYKMFAGFAAMSMTTFLVVASFSAPHAGVIQGFVA